MYKENIICTVIIVLIIIGNIITQKYTKTSVEETSATLTELREEITKEDNEINGNEAKEKIDKIHEMWDQKHDLLAYYIEHDELEKIDTAIVSAKTYIETEDYSSAATELDVGKFVLEHIQRKYAFNLVNVF